MDITFKNNGNELFITMGTDPDQSDFEKLLKIYETERPVSSVKIDLKQTFYIQSKNIAQLVALKKLVQKDNSRLILLNVNEGVRQVLEITNLLSVFQVERDYRSYTPDELIQLFLDPELADEISDFIAEIYSDVYRANLSEVMESEDHVLMEYAVLAAGKAHDTSFMKRIEQLLDYDVANVQKAAVLASGWFFNTDVKPKLFELMKSEFVDVAEAAAASIALMGDESDSKIISNYITEESNNRLKKIAVQALTLINDDFSYNFLRDILQRQKDENLKGFIVKSLSFFNKPEVSEILINMLRDSSIVVREAAASSLVRINASDKIEKICAFINDKDEMVSIFAIKAVGKICKNSGCAERLMNVYHNSSTRVKAAIIEALGNIGVDNSDFLYQALDDENEDIRKEALNSIFVLNKQAAIEAAKEIGGKDKSWVVRFKAVEILESIKPIDIKDILESFIKNEDNRYVRDKITSIIGDI